jgi:hypothetical protein
MDLPILRRVGTALDAESHGHGVVNRIAPHQWHGYGAQVPLDVAHGGFIARKRIGAGLQNFHAVRQAVAIGIGKGRIGSIYPEFQISRDSIAVGISLVADIGRLGPRLLIGRLTGTAGAALDVTTALT